jgi:hypothetical protein
MLEFRADEKTAEKLTEIADTLDISRSDLLLSMVKFALTNHQWARFGLTHKTLPRYEENPIMATKKFSPAQIAAQKLFAERARAGTLGKGTKRKANPVGEIEIPLGGNKYGIIRPAGDGYGGQIFTAFYFQKSKTGFKNEVETDLIESKDFKTMNGASKFLASRNRKTNPDKAKPRAYVKRASQATGAPPSKRLVTRRKKALTAPAGYFPNPYTMSKSKEKANFPFCVETKATENWSIKACFKTMQPAKEYAVALSKQYPNLTIRVMQYAGGAM